MTHIPLLYLEHNCVKEKVERHCYNASCCFKWNDHKRL